MHTVFSGIWEDSREVVSHPIRSMVGPCYVHGIMRGEGVEDLHVEVEQDGNIISYIYPVVIIVWLRQLPPKAAYDRNWRRN